MSINPKSNVQEGFLLCPIPDWPLPAKLVDKISPNKIVKCSASVALKRIQEGIQAVLNANVTDQFFRYAENCLQYSRQPEFERSFIPRKARLEDKNLKKWAAQLLERGVNNAGEITEHSMDLLKDWTLMHMNSRYLLEGQENEYREDTPLADESLNEYDSLEISDDTDNDDDDDEPLLTGSLSNYLHSPYKPKLMIQQINEAKNRYYIAFSSVAETSIHSPTRSIFHRYKQQQESLETLKSSQPIFKELINLLDETIDFEDFSMNVWKIWEPSAAKDLVRVISLTLTDFWGMTSRKNFDTKQERSFWVETVVPMFKYLATTGNLLVLSWCESLVHSHLQSQVVAGVWNNTTNKLFADMLTLHMELLIQKTLKTLLKRQHDHLVDVNQKETVRFCLQNSGILEA
ncbi:hypothetical protein BDC45DRAFT_556577 [Circinella umbellata]|nr:hypothetical protein BDC45DRAFT_556577 [Circinella umbellata]